MNLKYWNNKVIFFKNQKEAELILNFLIGIGIKTKWKPTDNFYKFGNDVDAWKIDYQFNEREAVVIVPDKPIQGNYWVWRAEFLGAFDYADKALLEKGWHIVYYKVSNMYGSSEAISLMKIFRDDVVKRFKLSEKADIFGFSRGGLYSVNYSAKYPMDVNLMYLDAPVLDIKSWPAGWGKGVGAEKEWHECLNCYGITEEEARNLKQNPLDKIELLIIAKIPIILVAGDDDEVVPYEENGAIFAEEYIRKGGEIEVMVKAKCGHNPHSLNPPDRIVEFIERNHMVKTHT